MTKKLLDHSVTPLWTALKDYREQKVLSFDVPGHKKQAHSVLAKVFGKELLELDANSQKPLDNMVNPIGVIKDAELLMADAYGADYAFFLVNGTTHGVQSMIMSVCDPGDKIIMPRNVHKSAIKALILSGANPVYMQPEIHDVLGIANGVSFESVKETIDQNLDAKAVFIINPTYYGMVSDLKSIVEYAHSKDIAVIVDEAHGALFAFSDQLPISAMEAGADLSSASLHKTCGSLTQSSVLLVNEERVTKEKVKTILNLTQTTSASYLLMSSLDIVRKNLVLNGSKGIQEILRLTQYARDEINKIDGYYAFTDDLMNKKGIYNIDKTKLGIKVCDIGLSGLHVYDILRDEYNIQVEFGDTNNILAIVGLDDREEMLDQLIYALNDIRLKYSTDDTIEVDVTLQNPEVILSPREAFYKPKKKVLLRESKNKICGEHIMSYPPGIPIVSPGERISEEMIDYIAFLKREKSMLTGTEDPNVDTIKIIEG